MWKKILPLISVLLFLLPEESRSQDLSFNWANALALENQPEAFTTDEKGNSYFAVLSKGDLDFDPGSGNTTVTNNLNGFYGTCLTKYDSSGNLIWLKGFFSGVSTPASSGQFRPNAIAVDSEGAVYITGSLRGYGTMAVDFDPGPGTFFLPPPPDQNSLSIIIVKLNANGELEWASQLDGDGNAPTLTSNTGIDLKISSGNNLYLVGTFNGSVDFDPGPGVSLLESYGATVLGSGCLGCNAMFVAKFLAETGELVWAKKIDAADAYPDIAPTALVIDKNEYVYTTGSFRKTFDFDPSSESFPLIENGGDGSYGAIFILKLDSNGSFIWAKQITGMEGRHAADMILDLTGNLIITGGFRGIADFNPNPGTNNTELLYAQNYSGIGDTASAMDAFVLKLNKDGDFIWVKQIGGTLPAGIDGDYRTQIAMGKQLTTDATGAIYTQGEFYFPTDFDPGQSSYLLDPLGKQDVFLQKLDANGDWEWTIKTGNPSDTSSRYTDYHVGIGSDKWGNLYTAGMFIDTLDVGINGSPHDLISSRTLNNNNDTVSQLNLYMRKLGKSCPILTSDTVVMVCDSTTLNMHSYSTTGIYSQIFQTAEGCDSVFLADVTIQKDYVEITDTACKVYQLNGHAYTNSGHYIQTYTNVEGCDSILALHLTINRPDTSVIQSGRTLSALQTDADHYRWIDCRLDNSPIPGATRSGYTPVEDGIYALVIGIGDCTDTSDCYIVGEVPVGLSQPQDKNPIELHPNPTSHHVNIITRKSLLNGQLRILTLTGQMVYTKEDLTGNTFTIDLKGLSSGIYLIDLQSEYGHWRKKLIKN